MKKTHLKKVLLLAALCLMGSTGVRGQGNPAFNDPDNINAGNNVFFFDKNSNCNGPKRELYNSEAIIRGSDISSTQLGPATCTIILMSQGQFEGTLLDIQVVSMNIQDCGTKVSIYDGDGPQVLLMTYDCHSSQNQNMKRVITTGNIATFVMTRMDVESVNFDIQIRVKPVRGGTDPGWENNYNRDNPFAFDKFDQEAIVGMVGGFYALVLIICVGVVIYWYRTFTGLNKEWETHQLATLKTGSVFGPPSHATASRAWSVDLPPHPRTGPASQLSRKPGVPSEDGDSIIYNEERFQARRLVTEEKDGVRPRYATTNFSYSDREDNPDHFKEKVITTRARAINRRSQNPPSYDEAVSVNGSEKSSEEEEEESSSDGSVGKKSLSSEGASSRRTRSSRSRSRSDSESGSEESDGSGSSAPSSRGRWKRRDRGAKSRRPPPPAKSHRSRGRRDSSDGGSGTTAASRRRPPAQPQPPPMAMQPVPYAAAPGQFVPVMAGPPLQMVPGYPPPQYPHAPPHAPPQAPPSQPQVQPTNPPVYSYLVRRGYTPLDQLSGVSQPSSQGSAIPEEPDLRLSSGVDYMRR